MRCNRRTVEQRAGYCIGTCCYLSMDCQFHHSRNLRSQLDGRWLSPMTNTRWTVSAVQLKAQLTPENEECQDMLYLKGGYRNQTHHPKTAPVVYMKKPERQLVKRTRRAVRQHPLQIRIPAIPYVYQAVSLLDFPAPIKDQEECQEKGNHHNGWEQMIGKFNISHISYILIPRRLWSYRSKQNIRHRDRSCKLVSWTIFYHYIILFYFNVFSEF